jgi:hypothetical protein
MHISKGTGYNKEQLHHWGTGIYTNMLGLPALPGHLPESLSIEE